MDLANGTIDHVLDDRIPRGRHPAHTTNDKERKPGLQSDATRFAFGDHWRYIIRCAVLSSNQGDECNADRDAEIVGAVRGQRFDKGPDGCPCKAGDGNGQRGIEFGVGRKCRTG